MMRSLILMHMILMLSASLFGQPESIYAELLSKYVSEEGHVNYRGFINEKEIFQVYLEYLSQNPPSEQESDNVKLAYWINSYNAFTVKLIIDNYPIESIRDLNPIFFIPGVNTVWHIQFFQIDEQDFCLEEIEHNILRKEFDEVRIHFAINCASNSCPKLRNEPYKADILNAQLEEQTLDFLMDEKKNRIQPDKLELSQVFNWFQGDFGGREGIIQFIGQYSDLDIEDGADISYLTYDWSLNE